MIHGGCIVGVDVGSTKICAVVAAVHPGRSPTDPLEILGLGVTRSEGMDGPGIGVLESTTRAVRTAVRQRWLAAKWRPPM